MFLAIDVGNTNTVLGLFEGDKLIFSSRVFTCKDSLSDEYAVLFSNLFKMNSINVSKVDSCVVSSVVPKLTEKITQAAEKISGYKPIVIAAGIKTGINIMIDNPSQLGSDMVANAAGAAAHFPLPAIVIDLGTGLTFSVVDENKTFLGGAITAGVRTSLDGLIMKASKLPDIHIETPRNVIGKNTIDCMQSGIVYGTASLIDGMVERISEEKGKKFTVIATGGLSRKIVPNCKTDIIIEPNLMLYGMLEINKLNS